MDEFLTECVLIEELFIEMSLNEYVLVEWVSMEWVERLLIEYVLIEQVFNWMFWLILLMTEKWPYDCWSEALVLFEL